MRIGVIGAGAMGCLYGSLLSAKNEVYMIDSNPSVVEFIHANGIIVKDSNRESTYHPKAFISSVNNLEPMDLVIIFVKTLYTKEALKTNMNLISPNTYVLSLQNGAGNDRDLGEFVKKDKILIGTTEHNCLNIKPGQIKHNTSGITNIGMMEEDENALNAVMQVFAESSIETNIKHNIQEIIWHKLLINLSLNTLTAVLGTKVGYLAIQQDAMWLVKALAGEAIDVAIADGTYFNKEEMLANLEQITKLHIEAITSMSQDVKNHRLTEIDHINGAIVECARQYGLETPYNAFMVHLLHAVEGTWTDGSRFVL